MKPIIDRVMQMEKFMKRMNKKPPYELVFNESTANALEINDGDIISSTTIRVFTDDQVSEMDGTKKG